MGGGYLNNAGNFLIDLVFDLFILAVMLRFFLQYVRADFYNPIAQAIVKLTNPVLRLLRRFIPSAGSIDSASLVALLVLKMAYLLLVLLLAGRSGNLLGVLVLSLAQLLDMAVYIFFGAIIVLIIASWIAPGSRNPVLDLAQALARPLLRPASSLIPPIGGMDLSPMLIIILLKLTQMVIIAPISDFGVSLL